MSQAWHLSAEYSENLIISGALFDLCCVHWLVNFPVLDFNCYTILIDESVQHVFETQSPLGDVK